MSTPRSTFPARTFVWFAVLLSMLAGRADAQRIPGLDSLIAKRMAEAHIPGLAAALIDSGRVVWTGTFGYADVGSKTRVTDSTPFQIASVSKTITATILMTLYAAGRFGLEDDVNRYLPFSVRNPSHPTAPITFRQLLNHRSSIADNMTFYGPYWSKSNGDVRTPLGSYLENYLSPKGRDYAAANFLKAAPGDTTQYCNTCYALIGFLAERISGQPFAALSAATLFEPLGMRETHWFASDFAPNVPATPHRYAADTGFVGYGQNGYPDWPAGTLRTSIRDLARFLAMYASGGVADGKRVLAASVVTTMAPSDLHGGFLTWWPLGVSNGEVLYNHGGGDNGVRTTMAVAPGGKRAVVILTNGEVQVEQLAAEIYARMRERPIQ
ncbi:MAG: beta-lactamase family protein [Gemmatimonadetes bacterium]|nr:beta-lactamase family protein [Gemmatimonadota bacterium]